MVVWSLIWKDTVTLQVPVTAFWSTLVAGLVEAVTTAGWV